MSDYGMKIQSSMSNREHSGYRLMSNKEAEKYIIANGLKTSDWSLELMINNRSCLTYKMPNGKILLVSGNRRPQDDNYPCFLYDNIDAFEKMKAENYFPIPDEFKTEYELEDEFLRKKDVGHFIDVVNGYLPGDSKLSETTLDRSGIDKAYDKVFACIKKKDVPVIEKRRLVLAFSVVMIKFLADRHSGSISLLDRYAGFNPIVKPELYTTVYVPIENCIYSSLERGTKDAAKKQFYNGLIIFDPNLDYRQK